MTLDAQINFRTSSEVKAKIEEIAKSRNLKPSQLINEIVLDFLTQRDKVSRSSEGIDLETVYQMVTTQGRRIEMLEKKSAA
jgi:predicted transcriptional regulator